MFSPKRFKKFNFKDEQNKRSEIEPDEIFLDSSNLPQFDVYQFEGRIEKAIPLRTLTVLGLVLAFCMFLYLSRLWSLQINHGTFYAEKGENNRLRHTTIFSERGVIYDRNGNLLAWNVPNANTDDFAARAYVNSPGFGHLLGYIKYPLKDKSGFYYSETYSAKDGVEQFFDQQLAGQNGVKIVETDALGHVQSANVIEPPKQGKNITLSIDSAVQKELYQAVKDIAGVSQYVGGAAALMNIQNGEILGLVSYPEFDPNVMTQGMDASKIKSYVSSQNNPFLNRFTDGLYAPGSIVKPILALAVLNEHVIDPLKKILSTGSISIPSPYDPNKQSVFKDWRPQGWVDLRQALAVSSDVYFYEVGGGFQDQPGLGIDKMEKYFRLFGLGQAVDQNSFFGSKSGTIPNPVWKSQNFNGDIWRVGDSYHTAIGQYGLAVTPMQMLLATAAIANDGVMPKPTIEISTGKVVPQKIISMPADYFKIVKEGMRLAVTDGTVTSLNLPNIHIAAKTGSAELGITKQYTNSWLVGFFPYEDPKYAFAFVMDRGPRTNTVGASNAAKEFFDWWGSR